MNKPKGFDEVEAFASNRKLPAGGYVCKIVKAEEQTSRNGNDQFLLYLDIADGEYKNIFREVYDNNTNADKKWPCIYYQNIYDSTTGECNKFFKGLLTAIAESNAGFVMSKVWDGDGNKYLKGKLVGFVFYVEHFTYNGKQASKAKPTIALSIDKIKKGDFKVPDEKFSDDYKKADANNSKPIKTSDGFAVIDDDDDLPF